MFLTWDTLIDNSRPSLCSHVLMIPCHFSLKSSLFNFQKLPCRVVFASYFSFSNCWEFVYTTPLEVKRYKFAVKCTSGISQLGRLSFRSALKNKQNSFPSKLKKLFMFLKKRRWFPVKLRYGYMSRPERNKAIHIHSCSHVPGSPNSIIYRWWRRRPRKKFGGHFSYVWIN